MIELSLHMQELFQLLNKLVMLKNSLVGIIYYITGISISVMENYIQNNNRQKQFEESLGATIS
jgi:hypothetical protein